MPEITQQNPEAQIPLSPEEMEAFKRFQEQERLRKEATEFSIAKESEAIGKRFQSPHPSEHMVEQATEVGLKPAEAPKPPEQKLSNVAQVFIERLEASKSIDESVKIINEVLANTKLSPYEQNEILEHPNVSGTISPS